MKKSDIIWHGVGGRIVTTIKLDGKYSHLGKGDIIQFAGGSFDDARYQIIGKREVWIAGDPFPPPIELTIEPLGNPAL